MLIPALRDLLYVVVPHYVTTGSSLLLITDYVVDCYRLVIYRSDFTITLLRTTWWYVDSTPHQTLLPYDVGGGGFRLHPRRLFYPRYVVDCPLGDLVIPQRCAVDSVVGGDTLPALFPLLRLLLYVTALFIPCPGLYPTFDPRYGLVTLLIYPVAHVVGIYPAGDTIC